MSMMPLPIAFSYIDRLQHVCRKENVDTPMGIIVHPDVMDELLRWIDDNKHLFHHCDPKLPITYRGIQIRCA